MAINPQTGQRMGRAAILVELKALSKVRVKSVDLDDHIARLRSESDRGVMILAATIIEDALLTALERIVKCPNRESRDKIFSGDGPLASFSRKINFAEALGIITHNMAEKFHIIREVRNVAAHAHVEIDFGSVPIKRALACTIGNDEKGDDLETWERVNVRNFYLLLCGSYADVVIGGDPTSPEAIHATYRSIQATVYPTPDTSPEK